MAKVAGVEACEDSTGCFPCLKGGVQSPAPSTNVALLEQVS